jgi:hypothetical protein
MFGICRNDHKVYPWMQQNHVEINLGRDSICTRTRGHAGPLAPRGQCRLGDCTQLSSKFNLCLPLLFRAQEYDHWSLCRRLRKSPLYIPVFIGSSLRETWPLLLLVGCGSRTGSHLVSDMESWLFITVADPGFLLIHSWPFCNIYICMYYTIYYDYVTLYNMLVLQNYYII